LLIFTGQKVITVGYASGDRVPSTVSGCVRSMTFNVLTTACNVRTGFSGGPVFAASDGRLLGLTVAKLSVGAVNFVLPSIEFVKTINEFNQTNGQLTCSLIVLGFTFVYN